MTWQWIEDQIVSTVDGILALDEPWRGRFLTVIANLATGGAWNGSSEPAREDLLSWLRMNRDLRAQVVQMYTTWRRPE